MQENFFTDDKVAIVIPKAGDVLAIKTRKSGDKIILCKVKKVVNSNELILQKSTHSFMNWDIYCAGDSWVRRVWNLGQVQLTTSVNNTNNFYNY